MTLADRILAAIRYAPLDDDVLAKRLGTSSRQQINQAARRMEARGLLKRLAGPDGKIVNAFVGDTEASGSDPVSNVPTRPRKARTSGSDSSAQRAAESVMLGVLSKDLGVELRPRRISDDDGSRVEIDGASDDLSVLVECWARQGPAKSAQKAKLLADAMKLQWIASVLKPRPKRLIICVAGEAAIRHLQGSSWGTKAIRAAGIEIMVVSLPADIVASIEAAQDEQNLFNPK